ncbi:hypothetical protein AB0B45_36895 [Nonomuraea sp. NPDC049152]|uniref:hypothetical protein n=1 Tax=Nonomuraea sp. NPDC049152 TaxID=3154350 RepID=UPI0033C239D4
MNDITARKTGTWALLLAGFTGAASALFLAFVPPAVAGDRFSFPLSADGFTAIQSFFFLHHLAIAWGLMVVWRSGFAGRGVPARIGGIGSVVSMVLLAVQELVAISAANAAYPSPATDIVDSVYGVLSLLNGAALIVLGIAVVRARRWAGWRRFIPLILGVYVIVPLTPAIFGPFVVARLTIGVWMLLFAALGFALVRTDAIPANARIERL